jgi:gliding motility-associated-like protein
LVLLLLDYYRIYIPNAFSPNQDGVNDHFEVQGDKSLLQRSHLSIYDRWGGQVYTGERWDGRYRGEPVQPGIYTYMAQVVMDDGVARQFAGSVTVVK